MVLRSLLRLYGSLWCQDPVVEMHPQRCFSFLLPRSRCLLPDVVGGISLATATTDWTTPLVAGEAGLRLIVMGAADDFSCDCVRVR